DRLVLRYREEQYVIPVRAHAEMIAVYGLKPVAHRVHALGYRLVTIVMAFFRELKHAEQLAIREKRELDDALRPAGLFGCRGGLPQPDPGEVAPLLIPDEKSLLAIEPL